MDIFSWGLIGLFGGSFVSATLIPFPSEGLLITFFEMGYPVWLCLSIATTGNTLGGLTNYAVGRFGSSDLIKRKFKLDEERLNAWNKRFSKYGHFIGLLAWLPIIGDPLVVALGFFKVKFWPLAFMVLIGKFARYFVIAWFYL
ncbi:MAG: membrane protein YqaA with SNARE-associated domain [Arenicella sp.]|jgi:membrane protein YqaA with SNARE-associated domain